MPPIFKNYLVCVLESGDKGKNLWLRRPVNATKSSYFCRVNTGGSASYNRAGYSFGFAPGFDI